MSDTAQRALEQTAQRVLFKVDAEINRAVGVGKVDTLVLLPNSKYVLGYVLTSLKSRGFDVKCVESTLRDNIYYLESP